MRFLQVKVTNLNDVPGKASHPKRKLAQQKLAVNNSVLTDCTEPYTELSDGPITDEMRLAYERFWTLLVGRLL